MIRNNCYQSYKIRSIELIITVCTESPAESTPDAPSGTMRDARTFKLDVKEMEVRPFSQKTRLLIPTNVLVNSFITLKFNSI